MKKYSVYVKFKNGQDIQFETNTNVKMYSRLNGGALNLSLKVNIPLPLSDIGNRRGTFGN